MPRPKKYKEEEVLHKAMNVFWLYGYEGASMQLLEKEMGINKFSIYASFGSKDGLFLKSMKCYEQLLGKFIRQLQSDASLGKQAIKRYFYDFVELAKEGNFGKGCLIANTVNELGKLNNEQVKEEVLCFIRQVRGAFKQALAAEYEDMEEVNRKANYLLVSIFGLSAATKLFDKEQLYDYIEQVFMNV